MLTPDARQFSPLTRGCSSPPPVSPPPVSVFPAHAGMFLRGSVPQTRHARFPRSRGDVPSFENSRALPNTFSPLTRGCSSLYPAKRNSRTVFPAHAGMFPVIDLEPGHLLRFPRSRGDVPHCTQPNGTHEPFSPLTRGCSPSSTLNQVTCYVFPAHAGMFPVVTVEEQNGTSFPRSRGDVPSTHDGKRKSHEFSPLTRGCSKVAEIIDENFDVFPAHAGMFPLSARTSPSLDRFPRSRGDVPNAASPA